jgi:hypothetical protein
MVNWPLHFDAIYRSLGVDAVLTTEGTDGDGYDVRVLDKTSGIAIGEGGQVHTVAPLAAIRMRELTQHGIAVTDLDGSSLTMNGYVWRIEAHEFRPAPTGKGEGQVYLTLIELQAETA